MAITADSTAEEIASIALAIHKARGLPITMKTKNKKGMRVENHQVIDYDYIGSVLEEVLGKGKVV